MQNYYLLISTGLLIGSFIPFALIFEKRKPRARELVLIAVMSAITVVANLICAYTVPFHAGTAVVIITGIALGPEAGFLTGALARLLCNFFMGQGIWTPWEMVAWAILGGLAGVMFNKAVISKWLEDQKLQKKERVYEGLTAVLPAFFCIVVSEVIAYLVYLFTRQQEEPFFGWRVYLFGLIGVVTALFFQKKKLPVDAITMSVFTFFSVFILYGGLMNMASFFMTNAIAESQAGTGLDAIKLLYITGAPYDAWHALGASICVFLFGDNMVQKLERIKIKYGMYHK